MFGVEHAFNFKIAPLHCSICSDVGQPCQDSVSVVKQAKAL